MNFENLTGLWSLLALVPFIIIYLRRPKSLEQKIPSLMFLLKQEQKVRRFALFRRLFRNLLMIIQLLILLFLCFSIASPVVNVPWTKSSERTVIVIDGSGSMQASYNGETRFSAAITSAKSELSGKVSIVFALDNPVILLRDGNYLEASAILSKLTPKATSSNIAGGILAASDLLSGNPGKVIVFSDFITNEGSDILVAIRDITSKGATVIPKSFYESVPNHGIVSLNVKRDETIAYVRNYDNKEKELTLALYQDGQLKESRDFTVSANSFTSSSFTTYGGLSELKLTPSDGFMLDNEAFISAPLKNRMDVLLITNLKKSGIMAALSAMKDVNLNVVNPPVLTINTKGEKISPYDADVIVVDHINNVGEHDGILPGTFTDISNAVKNGGSFIFMVQDNIGEIDNKGLLPFSFGDTISDQKVVRIDQPNNKFTSFLDLNRVGKYVFVTDSADSDIIASISGDNTTLMALRKHDDGKVFYYGVFDDNSDFKNSPDYPIFWNELLRFLAERQDIDGYNVKTGTFSNIPLQDVKTPSGVITTSVVSFDEQGIYSYDGRDVSSVMQNPKESDVSSKSLTFDSSDDFYLGDESTSMDLNIESMLLWAALIVMLLEFLYVKRRGDL